MIAISADMHIAELEEQFDRLKLGCIRAGTRAVNRWGLFVEANAVMIVTVASGRTKAGIHKTEASYNPATGTIHCRVEADSAYSYYIEMGFEGHFVPFNVAPSLYRQALTQWGWRVPEPGRVKNPKAGRRYLIPRGRSSPVWGVFVTGKEQPFLRPSLDLLIDSGTRDAVLKEEFEREFATIAHT